MSVRPESIPTSQLVIRRQEKNGHLNRKWALSKILVLTTGFLVIKRLFWRLRISYFEFKKIVTEEIAKFQVFNIGLIKIFRH